MSTEDANPEVPIHRSLTEPMMIAGLPRSLALLLWISAAAVGLGLRQLWIVLFALTIHALLAAAAKRDPYFWDVFRRAVHGQKRLDP